MLLLCALVAGSSSVWAVDETITAMATSGSGTNFSWSTAKNGGSSDPALNSSKIRLYASNSITFTALNGKKFKTIKLTTARNTHQWSNASSTPTGFETDTWTASDETTTTVTITNNNTGSGNLQISQFDITYVEEGGSSVAKPTFSTTGAVAAGTQIVLSHADADEIRYTTDGTTEPTKTTGTVYTTPITITEAVTIKAIAIKGDEISGVATVNFTISVTTPVFTPGTGSYLQGGTVTITSEGNTIYYTTDGSAPNNTKTEYTAPIPISSGKTTFKAIAYDSYGNASNVATSTITGVAPVTLPFSWAKGTTRTNINSMTGVLQTGLDSDYNDDDYKLKFNGDDDNIIIFMDARPAKVTIGVKMLGGANTSKFSIQESTNGAEFTEVEQLTISGSKDDVVNLETTADFAATTRVIKLNFIKGSNVGVGPLSITAAPIPVTITAATWASFSCDKALDFTGTGVTAYIAKAKDDSNVTLTEITKVPANTGIVVNGTAATHAIPVLSGDADDTTGNLLKPWLTAGTPTETKYYTLAVDNDKNPVFKKSSGGTLAAGKSYLVVSGTDAPALAVDFGETTGIGNLTPALSKGEGAVYNLNGQRIAQPTKGLYIVNGKKVVIK